MLSHAVCVIESGRNRLNLVIHEIELLEFGKCDQLLREGRELIRGQVQVLQLLEHLERLHVFLASSDQPENFAVSVVENRRYAVATEPDALEHGHPMEGCPGERLKVVVREVELLQRDIFDEFSPSLVRVHFLLAQDERVKVGDLVASEGEDPETSHSLLRLEVIEVAIL